MNQNEPAFPIVPNPEAGTFQMPPSPGLSKLELISAMAMQGLLANRTVVCTASNLDIDCEFIARRSLLCAQALLSELDKPTQ